MNYKSVLDKIRSHINYFKTYQLKINGGITRDLLPSYEMISTLSLDSIQKAINDIPKWSTAASKNKSVKAYTLSNKLAVYPDNQILHLVSAGTVDRTKIALTLVDDKGNKIDARVLGGGYSENYINESFSNNIFAPSFLDVGYADGMPLGATASIMVEFPESIKNTFTEQAIKDAVKKYCAAGVTPVIAYYA